MALPNHVLKYLKQNGVDPKLLPAEVEETLAGLSLGEVALLKVVGDSLRGSDLSKELIVKVH
jgi:hypothetical protein